MKRFVLDGNPFVRGDQIVHTIITTIQIGLARAALVVRQLRHSGVRSAESILLVSCAAFLMGGLAGCQPPLAPPPAPAPVCVDFEPPLVLGTQYGSPVGQPPGAVITTNNNIPVSVHDFVFTSGGGTFNLAKIDKAPVPFGNGQSIRTNNINLEFVLSGLGFQTSQVQFDFLDLGGFENISVNGNPVPIFAGELSKAPSSIGGVGVTVSTIPVAGGKKGTVTLKGIVDRLRIGGQEFWIDNVCATK